MKARPTFIEGVGVALGLALGGSALFSVLSWAGPGGMTLRVAITLLSLVYLIYLLRRAPERIGYLTTIALWTVATFAAWVLGASLTLYLLLQIGFIWLVRSLYFHSGLFAALADLGLHAAAFVAAFWAAEQSGHVFLVLWSFFLVQALFVLIPQALAADKAEDARDERFAHSYRIAQAALRRITTV